MDSVTLVSLLINIIKIMIFPSVATLAILWDIKSQIYDKILKSKKKMVTSVLGDLPHLDIIKNTERESR